MQDDCCLVYLLVNQCFVVTLPDWYMIKPFHFGRVSSQNGNRVGFILIIILNNLVCFLHYRDYKLVLQ